MANPVEIDASIVNNVEAGFLNMNYQSTLNLVNTTAEHLKAASASFLFSTG